MSKRIGDILTERGLLTEDQLQKALVIQKDTDKRLGQILVEESFVTDVELADAISERLSIPRATLDNIVIDPEVLELLPIEYARRNQLLPIFRMGESLTVAMADPLNFIVIDELRYLTKLKINRVVGTLPDIMAAIDENFSVKNSLAEALQNMARQQEEADDLAVGQGPEDQITSDSPVINYVNLLITQAVKERASDIHIEPDEDTVRVRYRISGVLRQESSPPKAIQSALVSRLKIMANMDVSEQRLPQDGRFTFSAGQNKVDMRVSTLPTIHGEKVVMRLLDRRNLLLGVDNLGMKEDAFVRFRSMIHKPEGLILISGPTGSGKTSTLYAVLDEINTPEKNIITVEDPVEYNLSGINQVQTNDKIDLSFSTCLRAILRQNPDIIMVGEIRDRETATMAVRSAMTGHLVLSTIHTNDAAGAVTRLVDMGIEGFLLASSLLGVIAQRLVREVCPSCRAEEELPASALLDMEIPAGENPTFYHGTGCDRCGQTGFQGRTGVFEVLTISPAIKELILVDSASGAIKKQGCVEGMTTLHQEALGKALKGITTYGEVKRVSQQSEEQAIEHAESVPV